MRIAVIGAGVTGVACAYELAADGHTVTVLERRGSVAVESSFGTAGIVGAGPIACATWPGTRTTLRQLQLPFSLETFQWAWQWHRAGRKPQPHAALLELAHQGRKRQQALAQTLGFELDQAQGHLLLLRTRGDATRIATGLAWLHETGVAHQSIDAAQCLAVEPGLNPQAPLHGGIYLPEDTAGNCRQFTLMLRAAAEQRGARFRFHHDVTAIHTGTNVRLHITPAPSGDTTLLTALPDTSRRASRSGASAPAHEQAHEHEADAPYHENFDAVVMCNAMASTRLLAPLGLQLPMAAIWGASITAPLRQFEAHPDLGPRGAVTDLSSGVSLARVDSRLRVAGGTRLSATAPASTPELWPQLQQARDTWYPGITSSSHAQRWVGARATLPDGMPVLGASAARGIWLNLGHGGAGWALACSSARLLATQIGSHFSGRPTQTTPFTAQRYGC